MPLTEDKYFIWGRNLDGTVTLYEKDGDSFTKSKCKGFSIDDLTIVYDFNVGDDLKLAYAIGVEEYVNLFVTMDEFESIFKFEKNCSSSLNLRLVSFEEFRCRESGRLRRFLWWI